jgi:hypothetical protein
MIALPDELAVGADYGLTVMADAFAQRIPVCPVHPVARGATYPCQLRIFGARSARIEEEQ